MMIHVEVQRPHQPETARFVGLADDSWSPERVAWHVKMPDGCLVKGTIVWRDGVRRWVLTAYVKLVDRVGYLRPAIVPDKPFICPHCGKEI